MRTQRIRGVDSLLRQRWQRFVVSILGEILSVPVRNVEENLRLKGVYFPALHGNAPANASEAM